MKKSLATLLVAAIVALPGSFASARQCVGVTMPDSVDVGGTRLVLNGLGIREATVLQVDVYLAALYVPTRTRDAQAILGVDAPRRLVMHLLRNVSREEALEGFKTGLRNNNSAADYQALRPAIARLDGMFRDVREGEVISVTYVPGHGTDIEINGTVRGTIEGPLFGTAIFRNVLGPRPPNRGLRVGLLGGPCG